MNPTETPTENSTPHASEPAATSEPTAPSHGESANGEGAPAATATGETHGSTTETHAHDASGAAPQAEGEHGEGAEGEGEGEGESDAEGGEHEAHAGASAEGGAPTPTGEKKKRRRRRKKKPHDANAQAGAPGTAGAEGEAHAGPEGAAPNADAAADPNAAPRLRDAKKKDKKHAGPPRERPPVNQGDIVFGKIIEITDEAILVDIPGKAKAIFDRRELLILDEEDEAGRGRAPAAAASAPTEDAPADGAAEAAPAPSADPEATAVGADAAAPGDAAAPAESAAAESPVAPTEAASSEPPTAVSPVSPLAHTVAPGGDAAAIPGEGEEAPAAVASAEASELAEPPPAPKDPKVPRVILEVGADFIAVVHNDGARGGLVVLTHHPHRAERAKPRVEKAFNDKEMIDGLVTGVIKGGVEVDVDGLRAFAPGSHVELRLGGDLSHLVAKRLPFAVTQYAKRGRDVVLSRRAQLEEEAQKARADALARLKIGEEIEGIVRSVVPFGAFVDVGGVEGLVPLQEMSHNRADGPSDVFKAGEPTRVKVIKIDDKGKIWLSHRATIPDPWQQVAQKYAQGTKHTGKVARLQPFGAFIELESGVDGLIHLADLSINRIESPGEVVKVGDSIDVVVSHVDASNHKIALHPAPTGEAANETPQRVMPHKPVKAKVVNIESGGLVVRILGVTGRNSRGYVTAAGTGTPRGTELRKAFKIGQELEAKVIEMDPRRGEVKLSIKALSEEQERSAYQQYRQQLKAEAKFTFADLLAKKSPPR